MRPQGLLDVTITVSNPTNHVVTADVDVLLPSGLGRFFANSVSAGGVCNGNCDPGRTLSWNVEDLAPGASEVLWFRPVVLGSAVAGTVLPFTVDVQADDGFDLMFTRNAVVTTAAGLNLRIEPSESPVGPGDDLRYTIHFSNGGTAPLDPVQLTFDVPEGTTHSSGDDSVVFALGRLSPSEGGTREVIVSIDDSARPEGTQLSASFEILEVGEPSTAARAVAYTPVGDPPPLQVSIQASTGLTSAQGSLLLSVLVTNPTAQTQTATVTVMLPPGLGRFFNNAVSEGGVCNGNCDPGNLITWTVQDLAPGRSEVLWFRPVVLGAAADGLLIPFITEARAVDGVPLRTLDVVRVDNTRDLSVWIEESARPAPSGGQLTYTAHFSNQSAAPLDPVQLTFQVPEGATHASGLRTVQLDVGRLTPGTGVTRDITVQLDAGARPAGTQLRAVFEVAEAGDPETVHRNVVMTPVGAPSPLIASLQVSANPATAGELLLVQITVTNPTAQTHTADVTVMLPTGLGRFFGNAVSAGGLCNGNCDPGNLLSWVVEDLGPGRSEVLWFRPVVLGSMPDGYLIPFVADVRPVDAVPTRVGDVVRTESVRGLNLWVEESARPVAPGAALTYTVHYGNDGTTPLDDTQLVLHVPAGTTHSSGMSAVQVNLGRLTAGESGSQDFTVNLGASATAGKQVRALFELFQTGIARRTTRAVINTPVGTPPPITTTVAISPNPSAGSTLLMVNVTVTNTSASVQTADVIAMLPSGFGRFFAASVSDMGVCNGNCDPGNLLTWAVEELAPGASRTVWFRPTTLGAVVNGSLIPVVVDTRTLSSVPRFSSAVLHVAVP